METNKIKESKINTKSVIVIIALIISWIVYVYGAFMLFALSGMAFGSGKEIDIKDIVFITVINIVPFLIMLFLTIQAYKSKKILYALFITPFTALVCSSLFQILQVILYFVYTH